MVLMVFVWVMLMNVVDLILVDWVMGVNYFFGMFGVYVLYYCVVVMVDLNGMFGMLFVVLILMIYYSFKIKGVGGFVYELLLVLFGVKWYFVLFNLIFNIIEFFVKVVLLGMWLFGNMYVGELVFLLIVLFGLVWMFGVDVLVLGFVGYVVVGVVWVIFYILIVLL